MCPPTPTCFRLYQRVPMCQGLPQAPNHGLDVFGHVPMCTNTFRTFSARPAPLYMPFDGPWPHPYWTLHVRGVCPLPHHMQPPRCMPTLPLCQSDSRIASKCFITWYTVIMTNDTTKEKRRRTRRCSKMERGLSRVMISHSFSKIHCCVCPSVTPNLPLPYANVELLSKDYLLCNNKN